MIFEIESRRKVTSFRESYSKMGRDKKRRFSKQMPTEYRRRRILHDHNYFRNPESASVVASSEDEPWKGDRSLFEWDVLFTNLGFCKIVDSGLVLLTFESVQGEREKSLGVICS